MHLQIPMEEPNMNKFFYLFIFVCFISSFSNIQSQNIDVTFRYQANANALRAYLPGEFNNWGPNSDGTIAVDAASLMQYDSVHGFWYKTVSLNVGGGTASYNGKKGYTYKFHEHYNTSGSNWQWFSDPLNPVTIGQNNDSFVEITYPLIFQMEPTSGEIVGEQTGFGAAVASTDTDSIDTEASQFFINDVPAGSLTSFYDKERQLFHLADITLTDAEFVVGTNEFKIHAVTKNGESRKDSVQFSYLPDIDSELAARPAGLQDGITIDETNNSITFSLFAPEKDFVFVIGNFNDWTADMEFLMKKDSLNADSTWFWLEIENLNPDEDILFQYLVDGETKIADPYSELVLDPWNDSYIGEGTFADIPEYPQDKTDGLVSWIRLSEPDYEWQVTDYERPEKEELVIYELLLRDFLAESNYSTLIDTLDYLENLGINAIELMPINEFDGNLSWGYNPALHFALDKYYGTPEDFKRFVDAAHSRGIAVIVDLVLNHATDLNPLYQLYNFGENPYFNTEARHAYNVFNDFNHQYSGTQYYVKRTVQYWIDEYNIDGFRWDLTKGFTQNCTSGNETCTGSKQDDRVKVLQKYADYQWESDPDFIVIFEHLGTENEEKEWANYRLNEGKGILLWGNMNYAYNEATMGFSSNLTGVLSESRTSFQNRHLIGYMESHDEERLMYKNLQFGNSEGDYNIRELHYALNRVQLAAAFFLPLPGPKMIWQFGELGYDVSINYNGRTGSKPIRWNYMENENRLKLYKTFAALLKLRHASEAFTHPETFDFSLSGMLKWVKMTHEDSNVLIVGNFGMNQDVLNTAFPAEGTWYSYFDGAEMVAGTESEDFILAPGEFKIWTTKKFEQPEEDILTSTEYEELPQVFSLHQNYPNPFNPATVISYQLAENSNVKLEVFDVTGRRVAALVNGRQNAGNHQVVFEAGNLASGIYITRLQAGNKIFIQKMTLIK